MRKLKLITLIGLIAFSCYAQDKGAPINIITYNLRLNTADDGINAWPNRKDNVKALIKFHDADILCVQEALANQFDFLKENSDFKTEGVGRDDGKRKGEFSAIYYNKNRFKKIDGGTFWLSETPDVPSKGWDATLNRVCSWVKLLDNSNKKEFVVFNTHFDHKGSKARVESAKLIKQKIEQLAPNLPVVFTGNLNVAPETEAVRTIKSFLIDARDVAVGPTGTAKSYNSLFSSINSLEFNHTLENPNDYIFVNKGFKVQKFAVLTDSKDQRKISDHLPVFAKLWF